MYITPAQFLSYFSNNIVYHPRFTSLLFQDKTLYITHALFLSCLSTKHYISNRLYFSPLSVNNTVYYPRSIPFLFQYSKMYISKLYFSPVSVTTFYITHALFLSCFSTKQCKSPTLYFSPVTVQYTI